MRYSFVVSALCTAALAQARGVTELIKPNTTAPTGCKTSYPGLFQITVVDVATANSTVAKRSTCDDPSYLLMTLENSVLKDTKNRTGYIASNYQFQFDGPPQAGSIYTGGFSTCSNGSLALGGSAIFYKCLSGEFYNLYNKNWAAQCSAIHLQLLPCSGAASAKFRRQATSDSSNVIQIGDGQIQYWATTSTSSSSSSAAPTTTSRSQPLVEIGDGQVQYWSGSTYKTTMTSAAAAAATTAAAASVAPPAQALEAAATTTAATATASTTTAAAAAIVTANAANTNRIGTSVVAFAIGAVILAI